MLQFSKNLSRRALVMLLVAAGVVGSMAVYRTHLPAAAAAWLAHALPAPANGPIPASSVQNLISADRAMESVAARVTPAVVNITVTAHAENNASDNPMQQFFGQFFGQMPQQQPQIEHGLGSGFIISPDGYIVTNNHVVENATDITVTLDDRRTFPGKVVGTDPLTDVAVVKINATGLPSVPWGDSTKLKPGQTVLAFGNPFGFNFTVTRGIVSALGRPSMSRDRRRPGEYIQTDAAINPGNSGGPLVDVRGRVIGIDTMIYTPSGAFAGAGFAIPTQIARPIAETLIKYGKVEHGYLGIGIEDVTPENARFFKLTKTTGALVSEVTAGSPGKTAGLKVSDVIVSLNGQPVEDAGHLQVSIGEMAPGTPITLGIIRNGQQMTLHGKVGAMPNQAANQIAAASGHAKGVRLGIQVMDLSQQVRQQLNVPADVQGVVIADVAPGSPADNAGLGRGMIIEQVDRQPVTTADQLRTRLESLPPDQNVLLLLWANGGSTFIVVHPAPPTTTH